MDPAVSVQDLGVTFRRWRRGARVDALSRLDLTVMAGEVVGVLGPNGSGKTSLLRVLAGVQPPTSGRVTVLGHAPSDRALVCRVGYQPDGALPFPWLSATNFLALCADLMELPPASARARIEATLDRLELVHAGRRALGTFSTGMTKRLALASALLTDADVLLLDEPTAGLDPHGSLAVRDLVQAAAGRGAAVLMASHDLREVELLCARVYVLCGGRCVATGRLDELLGTGAHTFAVRGLDAAGLAAAIAAIERLGGEVVDRGVERESLFAVFRRLTPRAGSGR